MRKVGIITLLVFLGCTSQAQIGMWTGGNVGFMTNNVKDGSSSSSYVFGPQVGFMLGEKAGVGINLNFNGTTTNQNNDDNDKTVMSGWTVEPFFRYYFAGTGDFSFFGDAKIGFGGGNTKMTSDSDPETESPYSNFGINLAPGVQWWFNESWSMNASVGVLGYNSQTDNTDRDEEFQTTTNSFGLMAGFNTLDIGLYWHF